MIKAISLQNFQSHKYTELEFAPGLNVIVGESDVGKTAVIRALRWVVWNRPTGESFRSSWGGDTKITIDTDDAYVVRLKKDNENKYILGDSHFTAFGTDVPEEVTEALNINEINLQQQLDSPFLLSDSPGAVAEFLNRIARLDKIDTGLQNVNREIRELTECIKYDQSSLDKHVAELEKYDHLEKYEAEVEVLESMSAQYKNKVVDVSVLTALIKRIELSKREIERAGEILKHDHAVTSILARITQREALLESADKLYAVITDYFVDQYDVERYEKLLKDEPHVLALQIQIEKRDTMKMKQESMRKLVKNVLDELKQLQQAESELELLHKRFDKEFPDVCPLCNQPVKK